MIFQHGYSILYTTCSVWEFRFLHILANLSLSFFLILVILVVVNWNIIVILIFISLMVSNAENLFMDLLAFVLLIWRYIYSDILLIILNWVICLSFLSYRSSLYILEYSPLFIIWFAKIFSHSVGCLFLLFWWCSLKHKILKFWWSLIYRFFYLYSRCHI